MSNPIILKLGGSVITKKSEEKAEVNLKNLKRIAKEIAEAHLERGFSIVVVHGAGPFGHVLAREYSLDIGLRSSRQIIGMCRTHQSMEKLNYEVVRVMQNIGLNAIAFQPSAGAILKNGKLVEFPIKNMEKFLKMDIIPVAYGDVLPDEEKGIGILSGDHLVPYLADKLKARKAIFATDVQGIFNADPKENKDAELIPEITFRNIGSVQISGSKSTDVTGGMHGKVEELLQLAEKGIHSWIISALEAGNVKKALLGEEVLGTVIK